MFAMDANLHTANFSASSKVCCQQLAPAEPMWHKANMRLKTKDLRAERKWTLEHLADLTGLSRGFLSQLETGKRRPSAQTLDLLSEIFKLPVAAIIEPESDSEGEDLPLLIEGYCDLDPKDRGAVMQLVLSLRRRGHQSPA